MIAWLVVTLASNVFLSPELAFVLAAVTLAYFCAAYGAPRTASWSVLALILLLGLGARGILRHEPHPWLRDVFYFAKPVVELLLGAALAVRRRTHQVFAAVLIVGGLASVAYVVQVAARWSEFAALSDYASRKEFGHGALISVVAVVMATSSGARSILKKVRPRLPRVCLWFVIATGSLSILVSRSRLGFILLLAYAVIAGAKYWRKRSSFLVALVAATATLLLVATVGDSEFGERLSRSGEEIQIQDYSSEEEINRNWRGFEAYLALNQFSRFDLLDQVFGGGFGQLVELDAYRTLAGQDFSAIPILHNGYVYVLIKAGILGALILALAYAMLLRASLRARHLTWRPMGIWLVASVVVSTAVISGPFNGSQLQGVMLLLGAMLAEARMGVRPPEERSGETGGSDLAVSSEHAVGA